MKKILFSKLLFVLFYTTLYCQTFEIYVSDGGNFNNPPWQILKFDENGENDEVFINEEISWPQDIVFLEDQNEVLISSLNTGRVTRHNAANGSFINDFANGINGPTRMKIGKDSLLYVLQWVSGGKVLRYELDGTFVDEFTNTGVSTGIGLDWDVEGNLYVSSYNGNFVRKYDQNGMDQGNFISTGLQGPTNIWFDDNGDLLVNNWNGTTVKRFDSNGMFIEDFITGLSNPEGVAIFPNGNILIGNGGTSAVKLFDSEGNFIKDLIESGSGNLLLPNAVVLREVTSVAVEEVNVKSDFVTPTIGTTFVLNPDFGQRIVSLEVYSMSGKLLEKKKLSDDNVWQSGNHVDGLYIIMARTDTGQLYSQKVVIKH